MVDLPGEITPSGLKPHTCRWKARMARSIEASTSPNGAIGQTLSPLLVLNQTKQQELVEQRPDDENVGGVVGLAEADGVVDRRHGPTSISAANGGKLSPFLIAQSRGQACNV
ncbi:MAG: hypothetical protein R2724_08545 [Bryobacterales bacterium]